MSDVSMPSDGKAGGIRGIDHIGITVPDLEAASAFCVAAFGAVPLYDTVLPDEPQAGLAAERTLGLALDTAIVHMRMLALGHGPGIELFEMHGPDQGPAQRTSDFGLQHFCVYVDDIAAACARFETAGGVLLARPEPMLGIEAGPGNAFCYGRLPWGGTVELLTSPSPEAYERQTPRRRYKPPACTMPVPADGEAKR